MICPKCEEGTLLRVRFKTSGKIGFVCDFCEALWFEEENINSHSGHTLQPFRGNMDREYIIEELNEKDYDHQSVKKNQDIS